MEIADPLLLFSALSAPIRSVAAISPLQSGIKRAGTPSSRRFASQNTDYDFELDALPDLARFVEAEAAANKTEPESREEFPPWFIDAPLPPIYAEAMKRRELPLLLRIVRTNTESGHQPPVHVVLAACSACHHTGNIQAATSLYTWLLPISSRLAFLALSTKARILVEYGYWEELSALLFQHKIPENTNSKAITLKSMLISTAYRMLARHHPPTVFQLIKQEMVAISDPEFVWRSPLPLLKLTRSLASVFARLGDRDKTKALIELEFILIDLMHKGHGDVMSARNRFQIASSGLLQILKVLFFMGEYDLAAHIIEHDALRLVDPLKYFPGEFQVLMNRIVNVLFDRSVRSGAARVESSPKPLKKPTEIAYRLAAIRYEPTATVQDVFKLWDELSMETLRQPGNAVDATRCLAEIEPRTVKSMSATEDFVMTKAAETGFTKETVFPLVRELISGYATLGDATNALRLFNYALEAVPQAHPLPVVRALEHVLRAIANDDSHRNKSVEMMEQAISQADKRGSWVNQVTVSLMMKIQFLAGRFEEAIYLFQRFVDTIPPAPQSQELMDTPPEIVPLIAPNAEMCNIAMKAVISLPENNENNLKYAISIFKRMVRCAEAANRNRGLSERLREVYWGAQRTLDLRELLVEMTKLLTDAQVFPPSFYQIWLLDTPSYEAPSVITYEDPDDDPFRCIYPEMSPNQETLEIALRLINSVDGARLIASALNAVPSLEISTAQLQTLELLLGEPFVRQVPQPTPDTQQGVSQ